MRHQFRDSGAKAIIILDSLYPKLQKIQAETQIEHVIVTAVSDFLTGEMTLIDADVTPLLTALEIGQACDYMPSPANQDDLALLQYTGGTTGVSKGAQLTHNNLLTNAWQSGERLAGHCKAGQETFICPLPLYHIYAFTLNMVLFASQGNLNVLIPNPRDLDAFVDAIKAYTMTGFAGLNTLFVGLCQHREFKKLDFSQLSLTLSGGTALTDAAAKIWREVTGCTISEGYGLSETSPVVTLNTPGQEQIGTVGLPLSGTEVQLWDENDQAVAQGQIGQVVVRGPQVMKGYWNLAAETAQVLTENGFFKTGDIGLEQTDGMIKIVDRLKDMINVSGFNVYPNEVEEALVSHPAVLEAAVIGEPDEHSGERVHAFITLQQDVDEQAIIEHCKEQLTGYKLPKKITIIDSLPKSAVGKILRRELRN